MNKILEELESLTKAIYEVFRNPVLNDSGQDLRGHTLCGEMLRQIKELKERQSKPIIITLSDKEIEAINKEGAETGYSLKPSLSDSMRNRASASGGNKEDLTTSAPTPQLGLLHDALQDVLIKDGILGNNQMSSPELLVAAKDYCKVEEPSQKTEEEVVVVCDSCYTQACFKGLFYCEDYKTAGTTTIIPDKVNHWKNLTKEEAEKAIRDKTLVWGQDRVDIYPITLRQVANFEEDGYVFKGFDNAGERIFFSCSLLNKQGKTPDE